MADIFISYKREERRVAERLSIALEQLGFDVWWDFELLSGDQFRRVIEKVIDQCAVTLVLWSNLSRDSTFVVDEATYAREQNKLCPARIDDCRLPLGFGGDHVVDLRGWDGEMDNEGFTALLRSLEAKTNKKARLGARARDANDQARYAEMEAFKAAQAAQNLSALRTFLRDYPNGAFANFVRGQLEEMGARQPQAAAAAPSLTLTPPPQPQRRAPQGELPLASSSSTHGGSNARDANADGRERKSPWPLLAGGALVVAVVALVIALRPWEQSEPRSSDPTVTEAPRDVDAEIEAARQAERERLQGEYAEREEELRQQGLSETAARQQANAEQAAREQRARDEADDSAWGVAQRANTPAGYDAYLSAYPSGRHASDARLRRQQATAAPAPSGTIETAILGEWREISDTGGGCSAYYRFMRSGSQIVWDISDDGSSWRSFITATPSVIDDQRIQIEQYLSLRSGQLGTLANSPSGTPTCLFVRR
jgi:hypothetical protein